MVSRRVVEKLVKTFKKLRDPKSNTESSAFEKSVPETTIIRTKTTHAWQPKNSNIVDHGNTRRSIRGNHKRNTQSTARTRIEIT